MGQRTGAPLAAVGLAVIVLMASGFHQRAGEYLEAVETALWASIAAVLAIGRWELLASRGGVEPWLLIAAVSRMNRAIVVCGIPLPRANRCSLLPRKQLPLRNNAFGAPTAPLSMHRSR